MTNLYRLWWLTFIDLRDRYWITQITIDPKSDFTCEWWNLEDIKAEYVLQIVWKVVARPDNMINKDMATWEVEINPSKVKIISTCAELPFTIDNENAVGEDLRLEYRYLDLRRKSLRDTMMVRDALHYSVILYHSFMIEILRTLRLHASQRILQNDLVNL